MHSYLRVGVWLALGLVLVSGCATIKESDTSRTGNEQLLISTAVDDALDKVDLSPVRGAMVFVDTQYLDCVDKNYVIVSMRERLLRQGCKLAPKPEESEVIVELASGGVGTDRQELFVGVPQIPLPPPSPISIPRMELFTRAKSMGTAKLRVIAYESKTRQMLVDSGIALARSDYKHWNVLGGGPFVSGKVPDQIAQHTGTSESILQTPAAMAGRNRGTAR